VVGNARGVRFPSGVGGPGTALLLASLTGSREGGYQAPSAPRSDYKRVAHAPVLPACGRRARGEFELSMT